MNIYVSNFLRRVKNCCVPWCEDFFSVPAGKNSEFNDKQIWEAAEQSWEGWVEDRREGRVKEKKQEKWGEWFKNVAVLPLTIFSHSQSQQILSYNVKEGVSDILFSVKDRMNENIQYFLAARRALLSRAYDMA